VPPLRLLTGGESHGPALIAILEGLPHGLLVEKSAIDRDLKRRQSGYGRGGRMKIERDEVEILSGLRGGRTLGSPVAFLVKNRDFAAWSDVMSPFPATHVEEAPRKALTRPRPGHADLAGAQKLGITDARDVVERASARSTAVRVAAGAICKTLLSDCGIQLFSHVTQIASIDAPALVDFSPAALEAARLESERSQVRCHDARASEAMVAAIRATQQVGDSVGGIVEVIAWGVPPGLGSYVEWDRRLDGRLGQALLSIQAIKALEVGLGLAAAARLGSEVHDPIFHDGTRFYRKSNFAGGLEGGMTNGEPLVVRAAMKPIPTLAQPLASVDLETKQPFLAQKERTDTCAVPAAAVVAEAAVAFVLCDALLDKMGGDTMDEVHERLRAYRERLIG
jgi:chorismate synthase